MLAEFCDIFRLTIGGVMYKVTSYSFWVLPEEFWVETQEEADELATELKDKQYSVDIEYIEEG